MWEAGPRVLYTGGQSPGCSITSNDKKEEECGKTGYISGEMRAETFLLGSREQNDSMRRHSYPHFSLSASHTPINI